jgi:hypothetical protein
MEGRAMTERADDFTRRKFAWLDQVAADLSISPTAFRLAFILASRFLNRGTGDGWPSQETLGQLVGITPRGIRKLVDQLISRGHLAVIRGHGPGNSSRYRPILKQQDDDSPAEERQTAERPEGAPSSSATSAAAIAAAFDEWWKQYPKRVARAAAQRAYERITRRGEATPRELLAGVMKYAGERLDQDPKYTKHPATWLNSGCWSDEAQRATEASGTVGQATAPSFIDIAMGGLRDDE